MNYSNVKFPEHKAGLFLTHNEHRNYYETVSGAIESGTYSEGDWISDDELMNSLETDEVWELHWYPNTPVGFCVACASTLEALLEHVNR